MLLASMSAKPQKRAEYQFSKPFPGVLPEGTSPMAMDDYSSAAMAYANSGNGFFTETMMWPGYPALASLAQLPEFRRISEVFAREMTRRWISFHANGDEDKSEQIERTEEAFRRYHVQDLFRKAAELDGFFGRSQIFLDTGYSDDNDEIAAPLFLNPNKIGKGALKGLRLIEPMYSYPSSYNSTNPLAPHFYEPQEWFVMGRRVHKSRLLTFVGREVPTFLRAAYSFGGLSLSQMTRDYINNFIRTRDSISDLIHSFSVSGIETDMSTMLMGGGAEEITARAELFNRTRDNRGLMMLNAGVEKFFNVSTPLGTLDQLLAQSQEQIASITGIPLVILLGISPAGLNASADGEVRVFYDSIHAQQEKMFRRNLTTLLRVIQLSEFGAVDEDITFRFEQLWQPNAAEEASIRKTDADTGAVLIAAGVIAPEEERQRLASDEDSLYHGLDPADVPVDPAAEADPLGEDPAGEDPVGHAPQPSARGGEVARAA
jgi:phage-related protein (TIGR01555 family)